MNRITALIAIVVLSSSANAGKLLFDGRLDYQNQSYNDAGTGSLGQPNTRYLIKAARFDYSANLSEKTSVRGRLILTKNSSAPTVRDAMSDFVDLFYINYKFVDSLDGTFGKFSSEMGGTEHIFNSSPDVYYFSTAYEGLPSGLDTLSKSVFATQAGGGLTIPGTLGGVPGTLRYHTGAKLTYKVADQEVQVQSANLTADEVSGSSSTQTRTLMGVVYKGNFLDKVLQPVVSFHEAYWPGTTNSSAKVTYMSAGLRTSFAGHLLEADYISNGFKGRTKISNGEFRDDSINTILAHWSMPITLPCGQLAPHLKAEQSMVKVAGEKIYTVTGFGAAVEFKPVKDENFRYHVAYNNKTYSAASGDLSPNLQEVLVGVRIAADILK